MVDHWIEGVDISVYQGSVDQPTWERLYQQGQRVAVIGSWHGLSSNPHAEGNLARAEAAGLTIATYIALNRLPGRVAVENARGRAGRDATSADRRFLTDGALTLGDVVPGRE